jgi:hypothetical protein
VTAEAVKGMKPGSVIVDMAASALGGNVELSKPGETVVTRNGVSIIAPDNLPAAMPVSASAFYARNISALLLSLVKDGKLNLDFDDEVTANTVITHGGQVVQAATKKVLEPADAAAKPAEAAPKPARAPRSAARPAAAPAPAALPPEPAAASTPPKARSAGAAVDALPTAPTGSPPEPRGDRA